MSNASNAYRVVRESEYIRILRLDPEKGKWVIFATLHPDDFVQFAPKGFKMAKDMRDVDLIYHIVGGAQ